MSRPERCESVPVRRAGVHRPGLHPSDQRTGAAYGHCSCCQDWRPPLELALSTVMPMAPVLPE